ncbi:helix-turn-helix domain-containing protein [Mammaliicoccus fleurettii]|uniref:helix-turn-helix domain-containing protein n=1 Tax=Mammaliicoccus fleurettii TaxID=150056 RepID=UPI002DB9A00B|nr:helix-turn-helix transcriptional regulator [Mammaliicoccus fleurettii]MEB7723437.1 helix-turn-helix domain-containing protein [Mammaliicoccus fleurettii]
MPNILGKNIKMYRKRKGINQKDFATKIGVSNVVLSRYESGIRIPDINIQHKIADIFEISLDELHGRETKERNSFKDAKNLMFADKEGWDELTEEEQNKIWDELSNLADFYIEKEKRAKGEE